MTAGIGGTEAEQALNQLDYDHSAVKHIAATEFTTRIKQARAFMSEQSVRALYLNAGSNLYYFTGTSWAASERLVGALLYPDGEVHYIAPAFERNTLLDFMQVEGEIWCWQEHEDPYELLREMVTAKGVTSGKLAVDESIPLFAYDGIRAANSSVDCINGQSVTQSCRIIKSDAEIALLQHAKNMTLQVHKAAASILREGISTLEVVEFINRAHKRIGAPAGSSFCIVLFGPASAYPHGVKEPQYLEDGDMVLIDTGCRMQGYHSDITRTYVFGEPTARQREIWDIEKEAQALAFAAAVPGNPCAAVDQAARDCLERFGLGPDYDVPGLPHRTGHGVGLDVHERPYLVRGEHTLLQTGMCMSNEPMICVPGEFGVRLEDHMTITDSGPRWFTQPASSIDDPFAVKAV